MKINYVRDDNNECELLCEDDRIICPFIHDNHDFIDCVGRHCPLFVYRGEGTHEGGCAFTVIAATLDAIGNCIE